MKRDYILKLYDNELMSFSASRTALGEIRIDVSDVNEDLRKVFPMPLVNDQSPRAIFDWLKARVIPRNRRFVEQILRTAGLKVGDTLGIIDVCKGLSINDAFWVDTPGGNQGFADVNLYDNQLDEALALVAYTGYTSTQKHNLGLSTEWTTDGQYPKAWRRIGNKLVLYKAGTEGYANAGMEPYSEYFASQLAGTMGIPCASYGLDKWKGRLASTCGLINNKDVALVPFWQVTGEFAFPGIFTPELSEETVEALCSMTVFDALIRNTDRHAGNYGFLRDNHSGNILGLAPLYDHNLSLFQGDMAFEFDTFVERADEILPRTGNLTFTEQCELVMGDIQHEQLRRVIDFEFENHDRYPVPQNRLDALNFYITGRTRQLLDIPSRDRNDFRDMFAKEKFDGPER